MAFLGIALVNLSGLLVGGVKIEEKITTDVLFVLSSESQTVVFFSRGTAVMDTIEWMQQLNTNSLLAMRANSYHNSFSMSIPNGQQRSLMTRH